MATTGKKAFEKRAGHKLLRATGLLRRYRLLAFEQPDLLACRNGAVVGQPDRMVDVRVTE